jgi:PEGA domain
MRKKVAPYILLALLNFLIAPGCAILTRARSQGIPVTSSPAGAIVSVNGQKWGATPTTISLDKKKPRIHVLRIESPGYDPLEIRVKHAMSAGPILGNIVLGTLVGVGVGALVAIIRDEPWFSTDPNAFASEKWMQASIPAAIVGAIVVDASSGKAFTLKPRELIVTLKKSDGPPRIDTILVDADDFQNIGWIRVRRD